MGLFGCQLWDKHVYVPFVRSNRSAGRTINKARRPGCISLVRPAHDSPSRLSSRLRGGHFSFQTPSVNLLPTCPILSSHPSFPFLLLHFPYLPSKQPHSGWHLTSEILGSKPPLRPQRLSPVSPDFSLPAVFDDYSLVKSRHFPAFKLPSSLPFSSFSTVP